jgi:hypothetical protein
MPERRINLRFTEEEFDLLNGKRFKERASFQEIGARLFRRWLGESATEDAIHIPASTIGSTVSETSEVSASYNPAIQHLFELLEGLLVDPKRLEALEIILRDLVACSQEPKHGIRPPRHPRSLRLRLERLSRSLTTALGELRDSRKRVDQARRILRLEMIPEIRRLEVRIERIAAEIARLAGKVGSDE